MTQETARCLRCRNPHPRCVCDSIEPLALRTRVVLLMHTREVQRGAATGPLALSALEDAELVRYGERDAPLDLHRLHEEGRRVFVLFPAEGATPLSQALLRDDRRPVTLVVPDGNWRQARRSHGRVPGLAQAEIVSVDEPNMDTFLALSRALGLIEGAEVEEHLRALFENSQRLAVGTHEELPQRPPLDVIFQDEALVAVNKPSGMLVHRGWAKDSAPALQVLRDQLGQRVFPLHRLDRATSGVLVFGLSSEIARDMQRTFDEGLVHKRYLAVCRGNTLKSQRLDHPLAPEKGARRLPASTEFQLLGQFERYGLIEAIPLTGRTHQIRKHLKHLSHPIVGDVRYGKGEHNRIFRERFGFSRLALHCQAMSFPHPRRGATVEISAPLPQDFAQLVEQLGLSGTETAQN